MFVIIGMALVIGGVVGGYLMHHGSLMALMQYNEFVIIGGVAIGSLLIGAPLRMIKPIFGKVALVLKGDPFTKTQYLNLLKTFYELFNMAKKDGFIALEAQVETPTKSSVLTKNPFLVKHSRALLFLCDTIKLLLSGGVPPHDLEALLDEDIETIHTEQSRTVTMVQKVGDALPGIGIVAAVLGIIISMQAINGPKEEIGEKVAAALVGTFLGILACYGFVGPVASHVELLDQSEIRYLQCIKTALVAHFKGNSPLVVVEFARRVIDSDVRPSFVEVEKSIRGGGKSG